MTLLSRPAARAAAGALLFFLLATANSGGYRFGASDQAFYIPAIRKVMNPALFPNDAWLLAAQGNVILWDGLVGNLTFLFDLSLPWVFFALYMAGVFGLYAAGLLLARGVGLNLAGSVAFLAMLTLRHRIAKTGVNTLEGYLHPRMLAFALGVAALAAFTRRRPVLATLCLAAGGALHPTTAVWFAMMLTVAAFVAWPSWRKAIAAVTVAGAIAAVWAILAGPLSARAVVMDAPWLEAIATKDYLFPHEWPAYAWLFNLLPAAVAGVGLVRWRTASPEMRGLLAGALALTMFFLATLPFVAMRYALAVQMQIPRVFWLVELTAFLVLAFGISRMRRGATIAALLIALSAVRGATVLFVEEKGELLRVSLPRNDWEDAMRWLRENTNPDAHVLTDPGHAWRYGSSVRVSAERDVFTEDVKDSALAMYDRDVALRVVERRALVHNLESMTPAEIMELADRFELNVYVTARELPLPVSYANGTFRIYFLTVGGNL